MQGFEWWGTRVYKEVSGRLSFLMKGVPRTGMLTMVPGM